PTSTTSLASRRSRSSIGYSMQPEAEPTQPRPKSRWQRWRMPIGVLGITIVALVFLNHDHRLMQGLTSEAAAAGRPIEFSLLDATNDLPIDGVDVAVAGVQATGLGAGRYAVRAP